MCPPDRTVKFITGVRYVTNVTGVVIWLDNIEIGMTFARFKVHIIMTGTTVLAGWVIQPIGMLGSRETPERAGCIADTT
jgi:putative Mn2+ efflux pump MntP